MSFFFLNSRGCPGVSWVCPEYVTCWWWCWVVVENQKKPPTTHWDLLVVVEVFTLPHRFLPESGHSGRFQWIPVEYGHSRIETGMFPRMHRNGMQLESGHWNIWIFHIGMLHCTDGHRVHAFERKNIYIYYYFPVK